MQDETHMAAIHKRAWMFGFVVTYAVERLPGNENKGYEGVRNDKESQSIK